MKMAQGLDLEHGGHREGDERAERGDEAAAAADGRAGGGGAQRGGGHLRGALPGREGLRGGHGGETVHAEECSNCSGDIIIYYIVYLYYINITL